jgi:hypothetical protein
MCFATAGADYFPLDLRVIGLMLDSDLRGLYSWMVRYTGALTGALRGSETPEERRSFQRYRGVQGPQAGA